MKHFNHESMGEWISPKEVKFSRMVYLKQTDPTSEEYKLLKSLMGLNAEEIKGELEEIKKQQQALMQQHEVLQMRVIVLVEICPHPSRHPYRACGVETAVCDYCGDEIHVRDY